jgi:hypothetical protein
MREMKRCCKQSKKKKKKKKKKQGHQWQACLRLSCYQDVCDKNFTSWREVSGEGNLLFGSMKLD